MEIKDIPDLPEAGPLGEGDLFPLTQGTVIAKKGTLGDVKDLFGIPGIAETVSSHVGATNNPHSVTKSQVGLGNVDNTSDADKPISDATGAALNDKEDVANKGVANGYAALDGDGKVPEAQLPSLYVSPTLYKGSWDADTNAPSLSSGVGETGWLYIVSVAGTTELDGISSWSLGDQAIFDGTVWTKVPNDGKVNVSDKADLSTPDNDDTKWLALDNITERLAQDVEDDGNRIVSSAYYKRFGPRDVEWYGSGTALKRNTTADASALFTAACEDSAANKRCIEFHGDYYFEQEVTMPEGQVSLRGFGSEFSRMRVTPFGADKKLLKFPNPSTLIRPSEKNDLQDFGVITSSAAANKAHPIAIWMPYDTNSYLRNIRVGSIGNWAFWHNGANNTRLDQCWSTASGYAYTQDETTVGSTFSISAGGTTLSVAAGGFSFGSNHIGKYIYVYNAGDAGNPQQFLITAAAGASCTVYPAAISTIVGGLISFEHETGSIASGTTTFTISNPLAGSVFAAADVGRWICIEGAGPAGGLLVTTIASRTSATEIELTDAASVSASGAFFYFAGNYFTGDVTADDADGRGLNDIIYQNCYAEQYQGPAYVVRRGVNVWFNTCKAHGIGGAVSRMGRTVRNWSFDAARGVRVNGGELDYAPNHRGNIAILGAQSDITIEDIATGVSPDGQPFFDLDSTSSATRLRYGGIIFISKPQNNPPLVRLGASMKGAGQPGANVIGTKPNTARFDTTKETQYNEDFIKTQAALHGSLHPDAAYAGRSVKLVQPTITTQRLSIYSYLLGGLRDVGVDLDCLYWFGVNNALAALVNLVNPNLYNLTPVSDPAFTPDVGYAGDGTNDYLRTGFIPRTGVTFYQQDDACYGLWSLTAAAAAGGSNYDMGVQSPSPRADLRVRTSSDVTTWIINDATARNVSSVTDGSGFRNVIRTGAGASVIRNATSQLGTSSQASTGLPTAEFHILGANGSGSRSARQLSWAWIGAAMSDTESDDFAALLADVDAQIAGL